MRAVKFLVGVLVGAAIGATVVLLIAPQSGDETQRMVTEKFDTLFEEGKKAYAARKNELKQQIEVMQKQ